MAMPCFLIVSVIAATSPATAPRLSASAPRTSVKAHASVARAPEPPPMVRGQRSAHRSIRRLAADPPDAPAPVPASTGPVARR
jgi:hypothetical protein